MFVVKVVNNSFALFGSLHYKVLVCCKTAADFSREIYFMRRTFTLSESQRTRDLLPPTAPPPSMPRVLMTICFWGSIYIISCLLYSDCIIGDTHPSLTHFNQFLGCIADGFCLLLASRISGLRCFRINTISTIYILQPNVRVCCSQIFMILSPCPPTKSSRAFIIIFIIMEISLFTIWSIYHLSSSSEAQWLQWWPRQRQSWGRLGWSLSSQGIWLDPTLWPSSLPRS